ncbi:hypothetical protein JW906_09045 [bacterium]|nr:hypothetical protein [bacterium]
MRLPADSLGSRFFYSGKDYGSESLVHPLTLILHGTFGILQLENRSKNPFDVPWESSWKNVRDNLSHPLRAVKAYGIRNFLLEQVVPFSVNSHQSYYWPNYTLHLIGGGMSYRMMREWYEQHHYPGAAYWSVATITAYHLFNEIVENNTFQGNNVDPIADLYLFDPLGILLFSRDGITGFFSEVLNLSDWSYQIGYDPWNRVLLNNGQNFMMRWRIPKSRRWHLFYHFGNHGEMGFSLRRNETDYWSLAAGFSSSRLFDAKNRQGILELTTQLVGSIGFFYDRNKSLLFSIQYAQKDQNTLRINIYPGLVRLPFGNAGFFFTLDRDRRGSAGITLPFLPVHPGFRF